MFTGMKAVSDYACAFDGHVETRHTAHVDSLTGLMSRAFTVMFDGQGQAQRAQQRRQVEQRRDAEFEQFVRQNGPFSRYIP